MLINTSIKPDIFKSSCLANSHPKVLKTHSVDYFVLVFSEFDTEIFKKVNVISISLKEVTIGQLINLRQNKEFYYKVIKWSR